MWELDHKEGWTPKNWCFQTVVLERILESPLDSKEIKPVSPKVNQTWMFIGRTNAETPILWPLYVKKLTCWKRPWCWERLRLEKKGMTEDEMVGWHHWLNGHESEQTLGDSEGQGSLVCCSPWGHKELDTSNWAHTHETETTHIDAFDCGAGEDSWESLGQQGDKAVNHKGNQPQMFIERTDEAEASILWPPDLKNWLTGKDPDAEKDWRWEEKGRQRMR